MRETKLALSKTRVKGETFWRVTVPLATGGRKRRTFKDRGEAQTYLDLQRVQLKNHGTAALSLSDRNRAEAVEAVRLLQPHGATLLEAARFYLAHRAQLERSVPVREAVARFLQAKEQDGLRERYIKELRVRLNRLVQDFGDRQVADLSAADLDAWLRKLGVAPSPATRSGSVLPRFSSLPRRKAGALRTW